MELTKEKTRELALKLQQSRLRLLENQPFYGLLLLHLKFSLDINAGTAYTDGERIAFQPEFLDSLSSSEVDFILMHEILHTALGHVWRGKDYEDHDVFNYATDIVVNSNILYSNGMNLDTITVESQGESMHNLPDGREGYNFSAEEIYPIIYEWHQKKNPKYEDLTSKRKIKGKPQIPPKNKGLITEIHDGEPWDNHDKWDNGGEGNGSMDELSQSSSNGDDQRQLWLKRMVDATDLICTMQANIGNGSKSRGTIPAFMEAILKELRESQLDWRTILQNFIQEDITDYSFTPPDRRFDGDFFLPDFNEKEDSVKNILFMIDTSGSMSDDMIADAFSEIKGAIDQFNGKLAGQLGFFDCKVYDPIPFEDVDELLKIKPMGRGGTDFDIIFDYIDNNMDEPPASIIILTDGYAPIPNESRANGIPVLWLLNNEDVEPEWGKIARIKTRGAE